MIPRSSKISSVRGWRPLPRDPSKGVAAASIKRNEMLRRARSIASVNPVGPAPTIITVVSYIVRKIVIVQCTKVNLVVQCTKVNLVVQCTNAEAKTTVNPREDRPGGARHRRQGRLRSGIDAPCGARAQSRDDEPLLLREG